MSNKKEILNPTKEVIVQRIMDTRNVSREHAEEIYRLNYKDEAKKDYRRNTVHASNDQLGSATKALKS